MRAVSCLDRAVEDPQAGKHLMGIAQNCGCKVLFIFVSFLFFLFFLDDHFSFNFHSFRFVLNEAFRIYRPSIIKLSISYIYTYMDEWSGSWLPAKVLV